MSKDSSNDHLQTVDEQPRWGWLTAILITLLGVVGASVIASVIIALCPRLLGWSSARGQTWLSQPFANLIFVLLAESLAVLTVFLFIRRKHGSFRWAAGLIKPEWRYLAYAIVGFLTYLGLVIVEQILPFNTQQKQNLGFQPGIHGGGFIMAFIALVILPPIAEEILFRGFLYGTLRRNRASKLVATITTSLLFAGLHLFGGTGSGLLWSAFVDIFTLSLVLCYLRERTGGIWAGMVVHALKNALAFVGVFIIATH